jgi:hypothetical protein
MSKYQLAIGDIVEFDVKFTLREGASQRDFAVTFEAERITEEQWREESQRLQAADILKPRIRTWRNQNLVTNVADGSAADYHPDALAFALARTKSLAEVIGAAYLAACGARAKN